ncbi:hypothetical protein GGI35DRAFT_463618 [Trichoderma velutinum]
MEKPSLLTKLMIPLFLLLLLTIFFKDLSSIFARPLPIVVAMYLYFQVYWTGERTKMS